MALILCRACDKATLTTDQRCQYCGKPLKFNLWSRKLRRNEAYGFLLVLTGSLALVVFKPIGIPVLVLGLGMMAFTFVRPHFRLL